MAVDEELVPEDILKGASQGTYFVEDAKLMLISFAQFKHISLCVDEWVKSHPEYDFTITRGTREGGIFIEWKANGTLDRGNEV